MHPSVVPTRLRSRCFVVALLAVSAVVATALPAAAAGPSSNRPNAHPFKAHRPADAHDVEQAAPLGQASAAADVTLPPAPPPPAPAPAAPPAPVAPVVPYGKGMWIWEAAKTEGGDAAAVVARAQAAGLTHLYLRMGSTKKGADGLPFADELLPLAHAAGLKVYGWDFPTLADVNTDLIRAYGEISHAAPDGSRIDGFVPDIETGSEGTSLSAENVTWYLSGLRVLAGWSYLLIGCTPNPTPRYTEFFPYAEVMQYVDAIAPMIYWLNREPDTDVSNALTWLAQFGKPMLPIGQAYDGTAEGGRPGPTGDEINRFLAAAEAGGAQAVSFWSWQHANDEVWAAVAGWAQIGQPPAPVEMPPAPAPVAAVPAQLRQLAASRARI